MEDITPIRLREYKPNREYKPKRDKKKIWIYILVLIVIIETSVMLIKGTGLTGWVVKQFASDGKENAITSESASQEEHNEEKPTLPSILKTITGKTIQSLQSPSFKNVDIAADMQLGSFEITINNLNIEIADGDLTLDDVESRTSTALSSMTKLSSFSGKLIWENSKLVLEGSLKELLNDYIKTNWKAKKKVVLEIKKGDLKIGNLNIEELSGISSGTVNLGSKMELTLDKDEIKMKNYVGSFELKKEEAKSSMLINGKIDEFLINTQNFNIDVK